METKDLNLNKVKPSSKARPFKNQNEVWGNGSAGKPLATHAGRLYTVPM